MVRERQSETSPGYARGRPGNLSGRSTEEVDLLNFLEITPEELAEQRAWVKQAFRPATLHGRLPSRPSANPWTPGEVAWAAVGAVLVGFVVGWVGRKYREAKAHEARADRQRKAEGLLGLDLLGATVQS